MSIYFIPGSWEVYDQPCRPKGHPTGEFSDVWDSGKEILTDEIGSVNVSININMNALKRGRK